MDNIRTDLQEVGCGYVDWIGLAQYRDRWRMLVSAVMNLRVPCNAGNFLTSCKPVSFSRRTLHHRVSIPLPTLCAARSVQGYKVYKGTLYLLPLWKQRFIIVFESYPKLPVLFLY